MHILRSQMYLWRYMVIVALVCRKTYHVQIMTIYVTCNTCVVNGQHNWYVLKKTVAFDNQPNCHHKYRGTVLSIAAGTKCKTSKEHFVTCKIRHRWTIK